MTELLFTDALETLEAEVVGEGSHFHPVVVGESFRDDDVVCLEVD